MRECHNASATTVLASCCSAATAVQRLGMLCQDHAQRNVCYNGGTCRSALKPSKAATGAADNSDLDERALATTSMLSSQHHALQACGTDLEETSMLRYWLRCTQRFRHAYCTANRVTLQPDTDAAVLVAALEDMLKAIVCKLGCTQLACLTSASSAASSCCLYSTSGSGLSGCCFLEME